MQLIFNIEDSIQLLPHFLVHYSTLGFDRFYIGVAGGHLNPLYGKICSECEPYDCVVGSGAIGLFTGQADSLAADRIRQQYIKPGDWYGIADLDEFCDLAPFSKLSDVISACEDRRAYAVASELWDRIAEDGSIPAEIRTTDLSQQFPYGCQITKNIARGNVKKVFLAKGSVRISSGHHSAQCRLFGVGGRVHHYKWHGNVVERVKRRSILYKSLGLKWWPEGERVLMYLSQNAGRIPVADPQLECVRIWDQETSRRNMTSIG